MGYYGFYCFLETGSLVAQVGQELAEADLEFLVPCFQLWNARILGRPVCYHSGFDFCVFGPGILSRVSCMLV